MGQPGTKIPIGTVLAGKYRVTREIGRGGMAAVYEAENVDIGKRVAIKVLAQELTTSSVVVERFLREARAAAAIRSPYICDVYDSGKLDDSRPFLVLELLEGESLFERLSVVPYLDVQTTIRLVTQVCRGLTKAHAADIVHRDLKPENIFLSRDEEGHLISKILDFGLAKFYAPLKGESKAQARLTREGAVFGTPAYMSPEQVRGQGAVDHRADLWALGCITYECLTGKTVWKTEQGVAMTFAQIASSPLPNPLESRPDLPEAFLAWFEKALSRNIEVRFQSARELAEALTQAFGTGRTSLAEVEKVRSLPPPVPQSGRGHAIESEPTELAALSQPEPRGPAAPPPIPSNPGGYPQPTASVPMAPRFGVGPQAPGAPPPMRPPPPVGAPSPAPIHLSNPRLSEEPIAPKKGAGRAVVIGALALAVVGGGGYLGWKQFGKPTPAGPTPTGSSIASAGPQPRPTGSAAQAGAAQGAPTWMPMVRDAQETLANGDLKAAFKMLKEAYDKGGHGVPRTMLEQVQIGINAAAGKAPCSMTGIARPRTYDLDPGAPVGPSGKVALFAGGRPSIARGPQGLVMAWTDAHTGSERAYTALLDKAMRVVGEPVDVTPEATAASRPELVAADDKLVLTYWDARGAVTGAHARWLDGSGKPSGRPVLIGASGVRNGFASLGRAGDGSFFAAYTSETEIGCEDLFLAKLSPALEVQGSPVRATDFIHVGSGKPRVRSPSLAVHGDAIYVAFRLERDPTRVAYVLRVPIADAGKGLAAAPSGKTDRTLGEVTIGNADKSKADAPTIGCGGAGCVAMWHAEMQGGLFGLGLEGGKPQPWRKKLSKGARPAIAFSASGQGQAVWFEGGRVVTAALVKDGLGPVTKIARVISDQPTPSIIAGEKPGEWYIAWLDYEAGHLEPYAARFQCR
ncbi:MAG TPA: protein kinase [Polyangiaceae bacterium]|nr:protein kinase [Polyangiaceae bacterium]